MTTDFSSLIIAPSKKRAEYEKQGEIKKNKIELKA